MRICFSGAQNTGKSTVINDFLETWPMYEKATESYRDKAKNSPTLKLNQEGNKESQTIIRDALIDTAQLYDKDSKVLFDRCIFDNLAYSLWLNARGKVTDLFIEQQIPIIKNAMEFYDIIFFIPVLDAYPVEIVESVDGLRDLDPVFRKEIDHIMKAMLTDYHSQKRKFFPNEDCPCIIELFGSPEERIQMIKLYVAENGGMIGEDENLLSDIPDLEDIDPALKDFADSMEPPSRIIH